MVRGFLKGVKYGQWLWLNWQSGHFQQQWYLVQIQFIVICGFKKMKIQKKRPRMAHLKRGLSIANPPPMGRA